MVRRIDDSSHHNQYHPPRPDRIELLNGHVQPQQEQDVIVDDDFVDANDTGSTIGNGLPK